MRRFTFIHRQKCIYLTVNKSGKYTIFQTGAVIEIRLSTWQCGVATVTRKIFETNSIFQ